VNLAELTFPPQVTPVKEWSIWDASKLQLEERCPRRLFYEQFLGWKTENSANLDLEFGTAWHLAMEHLLLNLHSDRNEDTIYSEAYELFLDHYRQFWDEDWDSDNAPKNPTGAKAALDLYHKQYWSDDKREMEVLYTEVCGSAPIDEDHNIHFKIDAIIRDRDGLCCLEHKTTKSDNLAWKMQWDLSTQVGTYIHALYCLYPPDKVHGLKVNGAIFRKPKPAGKGILLTRVPICKTQEQMLVWLWHRQYQMKMLDWNIQALSESTEDDEVMQCFPMKSQSCTDWNRVCPYHSFCCAWPNPLRRCSEPPPGFTVGFWNPMERFSDAKFVVEDGKIEAKKKVANE